MVLARFSVGLALLGTLSLTALPGRAESAGDDTTLTGVSVPGGTSPAVVTSVLDPVYGVNSYQVVIDAAPDVENTGGVNYPQYESGGLGFTPTDKNFFYRAGFTYDGSTSSASAAGGYAIIVHENAKVGGGFYYINTTQTETPTVKKGKGTAYDVVATSNPPGSSSENQFAGFGGSDSPVQAADRMCVVFYGVVAGGPTDVVSITVVGPGSHAPLIQEWKADGSGAAGTHKPTNFLGENDSAYNYQE